MFPVFVCRRLRNLAIDRSCFYGSVTCERKAAEEFQIWKGQPELNRRLVRWAYSWFTVLFTLVFFWRINPHLKDYIFSYGVRNGDPSNFDFLLVLYNKTLHSTKMSYLRGAAATKDQSSLRRYNSLLFFLGFLTVFQALWPKFYFYRLLNFTIDPSVIRSQDSASVFQYIALFPEGVELAWQFLKTNWASLTRRYANESKQCLLALYSWMCTLALALRFPVRHDEFFQCLLALT